MLVALARFNAARVGAMMEAMVHAHERDGSAWTLEWLTLPEMIVATGAATRIAGAMIGGLVVNEAVMRAHVADRARPAPGGGGDLRACRPHAAWRGGSAGQAGGGGSVFHSRRISSTGCARLTPAPVDWTALRNLDKLADAAEEIVERVLAELARGRNFGVAS